MINLSKSRYCKGLQCPKMLWLDLNKIEERDDSRDNSLVLETGNRVGELSRQYFKNHSLVSYSEDKKQMLEETSALLAANKKIICEASFAAKNIFCSVDILKNSGDSLEILEVKSSTRIKPEHYDDMAFQYHVLKKCGYKINKISLMHINNKYIRMGDLNLKKLFTIEDCTGEVLAKQESIEKNIKRIVKIASNETEPEIKTGSHCNNPYACPYIEYCSEINEQDAARPDGEILVNKTEIESFTNTLSYPLYYLDFETFMDAIPPFDNSRPYQQITCQFSLHIQEKKNGRLKHREFLAEAGSDPRRSIAEKLCANIPRGACVLAYYMPFEKSRISELASLFPDLCDHLMSIHDNMRDLIVPFRKKAWRSTAQNGSNSIKAVLPAMFPSDPELDYENLDLIHNGNDAMTAYMELPNLPASDHKRVRKALLEYCRLDTYAMVKILEELYRLCS